MPDNKPFLALKNAGIQADPDPMAQFRSNHPWIAGTADFLTGGATDPYHQTGPLDVAAAAPLIPSLGKLPQSLDYVTNLLKDVGYGAQASGEVHPAVRALTDALESQLPEPNLMQHVATSRVTGRLMPQRGFIEVPRGLSFGEGLKATPRVVPEEQAIWRQWTNKQKAMTGDPRLKPSSDLPELKQIEQGPVIRSIEELQNLPGIAQTSKEAPPLMARVKRDPVVTTRKEGRVAFKDMTPEHIKDIQKAAGEGMSQVEMGRKFPQYSKETITRALKAPWKD